MKHVEIPLKTVSQMIGEDLYQEILDEWPKMTEKKENIVKKAISSAYANGFIDGQK